MPTAAPSVALVSILAADRVGLVSAIAGRLYDLGINLRDTTFAAMGQGAEFSAVCELPADLDLAELERDLSGLPELEDARVEVSDYEFEATPGPETRITHRIEVSGGDQLGLIARLADVFREYGANIVRLEAQKIPAPAATARHPLRHFHSTRPRRNLPIRGCQHRRQPQTGLQCRGGLKNMTISSALPAKRDSKKLPNRIMLYQSDFREETMEATRHGAAAGEAGRPSAPTGPSTRAGTATRRTSTASGARCSSARAAAARPRLRCVRAGHARPPIAPSTSPTSAASTTIWSGAPAGSVVAVPGLVPDEVFFDHLANRRFPAGQFIRKPDQLDYLEEPDVFHDVFGHVPMLTDPVFADYMQAYGKGGPARPGSGRAGQPGAALLVHGGVRPDQRAEGLRIYGAGIVSSGPRGSSPWTTPRPTAWASTWSG